MKNYIIKIDFNVYKDSYEDGETDYVNGWINEFKISAENPREAIKKAFKDELYYSFDIEHAYITHEEESEGKVNILQYSNLVDVECSEATEEQKKKWRAGKLELYSAHSTVEIFELTEVKI